MLQNFSITLKMDFKVLHMTYQILHDPVPGYLSNVIYCHSLEMPNKCTGILNYLENWSLCPNSSYMYSLRWALGNAHLNKFTGARQVDKK